MERMTLDLRSLAQKRTHALRFLDLYRSLNKFTFTCGCFHFRSYSSTEHCNNRVHLNMLSQTPDNKVTRVQINLYASKLKNVAGLGRGISDPFAVVTVLSNDPMEKPKILGKTEVVKNNLSPKWTTAFTVNYSLGIMTRINVGVFDEIRKGNKSRPMGSAMFEVGEILGSRGSVKAKRLQKGGTLFVHAMTAPSEKSGKLDLQLQGHKLKNVEMFSKSDPFFEISAKISSAGGLTWQPVYRSKPIMNNLDPDWPRADISVNKLCQGDLEAPILIAVFDWEKSGRHRSLGSFETNVNGLLRSVVSPASGKNVDLTKAFSLKKDGKNYGNIIVTDAYIEGGIDSSHSRYAKYATQPPQQTGPVSPGGVPAKFIKVNGVTRLNPEYKKWKEASDGGSIAPAPVPSAPAYGRPATVAPASSAALPATALAEEPPQQTPLRNENTTSFGSLPVAIAPGISPMLPPKSRPNFVDYLIGGCELQMCVAIDFTGSNGDPRKPGTLHYIHKDGQLNQYEKAITAVGSVVARYDSDQMFPVWGFGAKYGGVIQHCFQVGPSAEVSGISGIVEGYRQVFRTGLTMSGPTVFAEVIALAAAQARAKQEANARIGKQAYCILLILTDGAVTDIQQTKEAITHASDAPLSIVIVGIGNADFSTMQFLDDFQNQEGAAGRDICQFVEFSKHEHNRQNLTKETLEEVPDQLVDYFYSKGIMPLPALSSSQFSIAESEFDEEEDIDLSYDFDSSGVTLNNTHGAVYDDTKYDTYEKYSKKKAMAPPPSSPWGSTPQQQHPSAYQASAAAQTKPQKFHVQVPPNGYPGMQLQIQNPFTGQYVIVAVPPGVRPGDKFAAA